MHGFFIFPFSSAGGRVNATLLTYDCWGLLARPGTTALLLSLLQALAAPTKCNTSVWDWRCRWLCFPRTNRACIQGFWHRLESPLWNNVLILDPTQSEFAVINLGAFTGACTQTSWSIKDILFLAALYPWYLPSAASRRLSCWYEIASHQTNIFVLPLCVQGNSAAGQAPLAPSAPLGAHQRWLAKRAIQGPPKAEEGLTRGKPQRISPSSSCCSFKVFFQIVNAISAAFHSTWLARAARELCKRKVECGNRSNVSGAVFSPLRWEVGAVRRKKGAAVGSQLRTAADMYGEGGREGGWHFHVHSMVIGCYSRQWAGGDLAE